MLAFRILDEVPIFVIISAGFIQTQICWMFYGLFGTLPSTLVAFLITGNIAEPEFPRGEIVGRAGNRVLRRNGDFSKLQKRQ